MRKRRQRFKRGGSVKGNDENRVLRTIAKTPMATGYKKKYALNEYAEGGSVGYGVSGPVMMASALTARSSDPDHAAEDAGPLATMPEGAPSVPEEQSYRRGGPVTGYQEGGDVEDYEDKNNTVDEPEIPEPIGVEPELPPTTQPEEEESLGAKEGGEEGGEESGDEGGGGSPQQRQQQGEEEGGDEEGGGGGAQTGYNASPKDQADRDPAALQEQEDAAAQPVGYRPQQAAQDDPQQALNDVLNYTRKQFGLDQNQKPQQQPQQQAQTWDPDRLDIKGGPGERKFTPNIPPLTGAGTAPLPSQAPDATALEEGAPQPTPQTPAPGGVPMPTPRPDQAPGQPQAVTGVQGPAAPAGAPKQLSDYLQGQRNFTPDQMTQLLDRATQENPHLDQSGSIRKAFGDLVGKGDMDGASRFVQSLRPSYDNLRAAMVAATGQGKYVEALQIAERLNNLIPNGNQVSFHPTENGLITAIVRPESGEAAKTYHLTPQQFHQYANGSGSIFDVAAQQGIDATLKSAAQGPQTPPGGGAAPTQVAGPPNTQLPQTAPGAGNPPVTGVNRPRPEVSNDPAVLRTQVAGIAVGLPGQAPTTTPAPVGAAPPAAPAAPATAAPATAASATVAPAAPPDRVQQLQQQPQRQAAAPPTGYQQGGQQNWPTGIPRGGSFANTPGNPTRDFSEPVRFGRTGHVSGVGRAGSQPVYDVNGNTYGVGRGGMPIAQQGQPGWQGGGGGEGRSPRLDQPPVRGEQRAPTAQQQPPGTGYQNSPARTEPLLQSRTPEDRWRIQQGLPPLDPPLQKQQPGQQQPPTTTGQGQQQPPTQQPQQQLRPDGTPRQYRDPYTGTPEQKQQQYRDDLKEHTLRERARQAYPNVGDEGKRAQELNRLRAREGTQTRHEERQTLDREKMNAANTRADAQIKALDARNAITNLKGIVVERERAAMQELRDRVNNAARTNKDDPNYQYPYTDRDRQLIDRMHNTAVENDLAEQLRSKLPNAPEPKPTAPAAPAGQTTKPEPKVDLEKYRGDSQPYPAPAGQQWGRSKSTGQWSLRPVAPARPTVPMSQ